MFNPIRFRPLPMTSSAGPVLIFLVHLVLLSPLVHSLPTVLSLSLPVIAQDAVFESNTDLPHEVSSATTWVPLFRLGQMERRTIQSHEFTYDSPKEGRGRLRRAEHVLSGRSAAALPGLSSVGTSFDRPDSERAWSPFVVFRRRQNVPRSAGQRRRGRGRRDGRLGHRDGGDDGQTLGDLVELGGDQKSLGDAKVLFATTITQVNGAQATGVSDGSIASGGDGQSAGNGRLGASDDVTGGSGSGAMMVEVIPSSSQLQTYVSTAVSEHSLTEEVAPWGRSLRPA